MNSKKEVLNVLPSLFEEFIDISNVKFYVKELSQNRYLCFAYDENKIIDAIKQSGFELKQIQKIYFSQIEFLNKITSQNSNHIKVDGVSLSLSKDIIVKIPENFKINIENELHVKDIKLSKESISISSSSKYIDNKTSNIFSVFLFLFTLLFLVKVISNYGVVEEYTQKTAQIKSSSGGSLSTIQLKSIIKKYNRVYNAQIKVRNLLSYVLNMRAVVNMKISSFELENKKLRVKILNNTSDKSFENKIRQYIQKEYKNYSLKTNNEYILLEVNI